MDSLANPAPRLLRAEAVCELTGLTRRSLSNKVAAGRFPAPVLLDARQLAWVEGEVLAWIAERVADRNAGLLPAGRDAVLHARSRGGKARAAQVRREAASTEAQT